MPSISKRQEIDHRTIKLIVGIVSLSLAGLTSAFATTAITFFIGFLFAIAAFLLAYNGLSLIEMILSKVAASAALGVALFPCECGGHPALVPYVHGASAAVMFLILTYFCYAFYKRARQKGYREANVRATIYASCGVAILGSILVLAFDHFSGGELSQRIPRLEFYGESVGLIAFGISWLTASRTVPVLTRQDERFSPLREANPM